VTSLHVVPVTVPRSVALFPPNAVADFEQSRLFAGHALNLRPWTRSTRRISLWPVKLSWPSSYLMVTYLASFAVTVPRSVFSPSKQTRVPTFSCLESSVVICSFVLPVSQAWSTSLLSSLAFSQTNVRRPHKNTNHGFFRPTRLDLP
jgi:hypothetical protein